MLDKAVAKVILEYFSFCKKAPNDAMIEKFYEKYPNVKQYIKAEFDNYKEWEKENNIIRALKLGKSLKQCKECRKFLPYSKSRHDFCSLTCAKKNADVREKTKNTNLVKYGSVSPMQNEAVKEKTKNTFMKRYGVESAFNMSDHKEKTEKTILNKYGSIEEFQKAKTEKTRKTNQIKYAKDTNEFKNLRKKIEETNLKKYGVKCNLCMPEVIEKNKMIHTGNQDIVNKIKETNLKRYGVETLFYSDEVNEKATIAKNNKVYSKILKMKEYVIPMFSREEFSGLNKEYTWKCVKCGNVFTQKIHTSHHIKGFSNCPRCLNCYPILAGTSLLEKEVVSFCKSFYPNLIEHDRQLIKPYELDIIIPEKKIAIEFNGNFWHSEQGGTDSSYHLMKTEMCEQSGYRLIHIFEHEWINKQELVKEKLKAILGVEQEKVYARKCIVKEIDTKTKNEFLNKYHIQGEDKSVLKIGLFHNDELVAVMTFGYPRFNNDYSWELIRYATSKHVIGGAGKLLAYFRRTYVGSIITYADRRFSRGNMYEKLGFNLINITKPNYCWVKDNKVLSRYQTQKSRLAKLLGDKYDPNKTEVENMNNAGFNKIYDCGNLVFTMNK